MYPKELQDLETICFTVNQCPVTNFWVEVGSQFCHKTTGNKNLLNYASEHPPKKALDLSRVTLVAALLHELLVEVEDFNQV